MTAPTGRFGNHVQELQILLRSGTGPRMLWHYFAGSHLRRLLVNKGILSGPATQAAQVRTEFEARAARGKFTKTWFDGAIVPWTVTFSRVFTREDPVRILEIGSWEGRSTLFFLTYFPQGCLTAVDTWAGGDEPLYTALPLESLEARFDHNTAECADRLIKRKGSSQHVLPQLLEEKQQYDIIYVDASHFADDVLADGLAAWRLLKQGGVLIFDDLTWDYYPRVRDNPAWPINVLLKYHAGKYRILSVTTQLILQKRVTDCPLR